MVEPSEQEQAWFWLISKAPTMWWTPPRFTDGKPVGGAYWRIHSLSFSFSGEFGVFDLAEVVLDCWRQKSADGVRAEFAALQDTKAESGKI